MVVVVVVVAIVAVAIECLKRRWIPPSFESGSESKFEFEHAKRLLLLLKLRQWKANNKALGPRRLYNGQAGIQRVAVD